MQQNEVSSDIIAATAEAMYPRTTTKSTRMMQQWSVRVRVVKITRRLLLLSVGSLKMAASRQQEEKNSRN